MPVLAHHPNLQRQTNQQVRNETFFGECNERKDAWMKMFATNTEE